MGNARDDVVVASFNVHAGVDGWGRPFDVVAACRDLEADVLVLQECWSSGDGRDLAADVASALGLTLAARTLARGRRAAPAARADGRWGPRRGWMGEDRVLYLDSERPLNPSTTGSASYQRAARGRWGIAVLAAQPLEGVEIVDLGRLRRDRARREVIVGRLGSGRRLIVAGAHMSHLSHGSPVHFLRLRAALDELVGGEPAVLAGDMNLWGPAVAAFFPGWRRAVRGRTWPSWRPHSQLDHILVTGSISTEAGQVVPVGRSDHLAVRARLVLG